MKCIKCDYCVKQGHVHICIYKNKNINVSDRLLKDCLFHEHKENRMTIPQHQFLHAVLRKLESKDKLSINKYVIIGGYILIELSIESPLSKDVREIKIVTDPEVIQKYMRFTDGLDRFIAEVI